jgi:hypothetical protein
LNVEGRATGSAVVALNQQLAPHQRRKTLTAVKPARLARWACLGVLVTALVGCSGNVTACGRKIPAVSTLQATSAATRLVN